MATESSRMVAPWVTFMGMHQESPGRASYSLPAILRVIWPLTRYPVCS